MKIFIFSIILIFGIFGIVFLWQGIYLPRSELALLWGLPKDLAFLQIESKLFTIEKGQNLFQIGQNLEKEGIIKNRFFFDFYVMSKGKMKQLQAGDYLFNSSSESCAQIAEMIIKGETLKEKITIIEGWNLRDIGWYFEGKGMFQAEELFELVGFPLIDYSKTKELPSPKDFSQDFSLLEDKPKNLGLEGYLFPDTYQIKKQTSLEEIIRKMLKNFDQKLTSDLREEIKKQNKTIFEIITMASLIEKEVYNTPECPNCKNLVSGILWKRLETGMPLQVDATIIYIKKTTNHEGPRPQVGGGAYGTRISIEETKIDSPYNTYKYRGLPPGPISNPGLESILAALYPKDSEHWYYLSAPEGETIFSKTLGEHNLAKAKYLK